MSSEGCVIIVDDDDAVRQSLTFSLPLEAHCMPSLDGLTLIGRLRQSAIALPAILITEKASAEIHRRATLCGCRAVLEKPLEDNSLSDCIRDALANGGSEEFCRQG